MNIMPVNMSYSNFRQGKQSVSFGFVGAEIPPNKLAAVADAIVKLQLLETIENFVRQMKKSSMVSDHVKYYLKIIDNPESSKASIQSALLELTPGHSKQNPHFNRLINYLTRFEEDTANVLEELSSQLKEAYKIN